MEVDMRPLPFVPIGLVALLAGCPTLSFAQGSQSDSPMSLSAAISQALRHSPQLHTAEDAITTAAIQRQAAQARYRPAITPTLNTGSAPGGLNQRNLGVAVSQLLASGAQVQFSANSLTTGSGPGQFTDAGYLIGISQPLLRGFGASGRTDLAAAERGAQNANRSAADAHQQLVLSVAQAYFTAVREARLSDISQRALDRAAKLVEMSEARARVGLSTQLDVLRAGLLRSQAESAALREHDALDAALDDLKILIGQGPDSALSVEGDITADLGALEQATGRSADAPIDETTLQHGVISRLDVKMAQAKLSDARWNASVAQWNLLPQVNFDLSYTRRGLGGSSPDFTSPLNGWRMGVSTTYSLSRSADASAAAQAQVVVGGAERAVADAEAHAVADVRRVSRGLSRAASSIAMQTNALDLAQRQLELATFRYERGLADNLEVVDAQNNVLQAEVALLGAQIDRALAFLNLQHATGVLDPDRFLR
jgi:outer membrane protein TolC